MKECNDEFPYCLFYEDELTTDEYENINGYIIIKKNLNNYDLKNYAALVYCPENENLNIDCEYDIEMKNENEITYLYKDKIYYSFVILNSDLFSMEYYKINLEKDFNTNGELHINFNLFSGNANIKFFDSFFEEIKDFYIKTLGNKKIFIFQKNITEQYSDLYINITRNQNAFFSINYEIKDENNLNEYYLEEGILEYGKILPNSRMFL